MDAGVPPMTMIWFKSIIRDKWEIMDVNDNVFAVVEEDSQTLAMIRRLIFKFLPQTYNIVSKDGRPLGVIRQQFNLFIHKFDIDFSQDTANLLDRRLGLAAVVLLLAIERRQE